MSKPDFIPFAVDLPSRPITPASCSSAVAATVATDDGFADWGKGANFRQFQRERDGGVATVAAVAGVETSGRPWAAGLAALSGMRHAAFISDGAWEELIWEAIEVDRLWGQRALDCGWAVEDLYGCHPKPWVSDNGRDGLVHLIVTLRSAVTITGLFDDGALLQPISGPPMRYRKKFISDRSLIWDAYRFGSGP